MWKCDARFCLTLRNHFAQNVAKHQFTADSARRLTVFSLHRIAENIILLEGWRAALLAVVAGAISALGLAPYHAFPVLFFTLPVLVWLLDGAIPPAGSSGFFGVFNRYWPAFRTGWLFGFGYLLAGMWWVGKAFLVDADEFAWLLPFAVLALPAGLGLFYGFGAALARVAWGDGWVRLVALSAAFTLAEWLRGTLLTGLPWNTLGMIFMPTPLLMQTAGLIGLYGVTFLTVFIAASPGVFAPGMDFDSTTGVRKPRRMRRVLVAALVLMIAHVGYGFAVLSNASDEMQPGIKLRIVQPGLLQSEKWEPEKRAGDHAALFRSVECRSRAESGLRCVLYTYHLAGISLSVHPHPTS